MINELREAKVKLINARQMKAGVENAKQTYINLLFTYENDILKMFDELEAKDKQIAELKEENELLSKTLEEQDKKLKKKGMG